jgi:hypothetical protein
MREVLDKTEIPDVEETTSLDLGHEQRRKRRYTWSVRSTTPPDMVQRASTVG